MTTEPTTDTPAALSQPAPTEPTPARRTGRRRLRSVARACVVTVAILGVMTLVCPGLFGGWSARTDDAVPRSIELPWHWQASVQEDPPGPAAVVATTDERTTAKDLVAIADPTGEPGDDVNPVAVVGRNGVYRALYPSAGSLRAGQDLHLSPDGRYLALPYLRDRQTSGRGPTIVDLVTGRADVVAAAGLPAHRELAVLGWRPDGGALLLATVAGQVARISVLDLGTGVLTLVATVPAPAEPAEWRVAFSPDGHRVSFVAGGSLHLVDDQGTELWTVPLPGGTELAGGGAFTPDGTRIALVHSQPCADTCAAPEWSVTYMDSADGTAASGPVLPTISGSRIRAVGWTGRDLGTAALVVVRYLPPPPPQAVQGPDGQLTVPADEDREDDGSGPADLYELVPGEPARLLLDAPYEVTDLDVAGDLVRAGRFEGEPSMPSLLPIEPGRLRVIDVVVVVGVGGGLAVVVGIIVNLTGQPRRLWLLVRRLARRSR